MLARGDLGFGLQTETEDVNRGREDGHFHPARALPDQKREPVQRERWNGVVTSPPKSEKRVGYSADGSAAQGARSLAVRVGNLPRRMRKEEPEGREADTVVVPAAGWG